MLQLAVDSGSGGSSSDSGSGGSSSDSGSGGSSSDSDSDSTAPAISDYGTLRHPTGLANVDYLRLVVVQFVAVGSGGNSRGGSSSSSAQVRYGCTTRFWVAMYSSTTLPLATFSRMK
ncbi:unnamed protein product [Phytophthora lilii]|uniref:Unnamed protein product n=1 Tax=Phytophthora lilii TaxID=2077276 RepID=A0A9W6X5W1_9STRA|nr:unnamed protein product [Phytophthora lilii]